MRAAYSCGDDGAGSSPWLCTVCATSASANAPRKCRFSAFTIVAGVPAGASNPVPERRIVVFDSRFVHRRHVGQARIAVEARHRKYLQAVAQRSRGGGADEADLQFPAEHRGENFTGALVGHVRETRARHVHQQRTGQITRRAYALGPVIQFAWFFFGERDQLRHRLQRRIVARDQRIAKDEREADRCECGFGVVGQVFFEDADDGQRAGAAPQERVAVGPRVGDGLRGYAAAGAAAVFNDDRRSQRVAQLLGDSSRGQVRAAAGREADQQAHRFFRIGRGNGAGDNYECARQGAQYCSLQHEHSPG